jgi:hypothetical protein
MELKLFPENTRGLPSIYNQVIRESIDDPSTLVFAHDDVLILDFFWCSRVKEGLRNFDIIGVAGNKRRVPGQSSWAFVDNRFTWDRRENLSGIVGHGNRFPPPNMSKFGPPRQKVKLLDGLLLAAESETLLKNDLFFDETFDFNFYDLDFCRQAEEKNLSCGTWDISLIHKSRGRFNTEQWDVAYKKYLEKWKE